MGQRQSKEEAEEIKKGMVLAENEGISALFKNSKRWEKEQVKIAITGSGATGKSTFINTIRNVKPGDEGFARVGSGNTTITPTLYKHPTNDQITFCDLPGYASTKFKKEDYISEMNISDYDFFFIFFNNALSEDEIRLVGELRKLGKPFALVRSKIDLDLDNAIHDGKDPGMIQEEIKGKIQKALNANPALKDTKSIFLISSRKPDLGEMSDLMTYVEENIDDVKAEALLFSIGCISKKILERKHNMLKKRLIVATLLSAGVAGIQAGVPAIPVGSATVVNNTIMAYEVSHYMHVFEFKREIVNSLNGFEQSSLKCAELLGEHFDMTQFISRQLTVYSELSPYLQSWLPFLESYKYIIPSATTAVVTYTILHGMLQDLKRDAMLIHEHIMTTSM